MFNTTSMHLVTASEGIITLNCIKKKYLDFPAQRPHKERNHFCSRLTLAIFHTQARCL